MGMYVLEVIPLSRTAPPEPLSYRSLHNVRAGTIIDVPLRKRTVPGLVVGSMTVQEAKANLKAASFSLSKSSGETLGALPRAYIDAAVRTAEYHATTLGAVLSALLVPVFSSEVPTTFARGSEFVASSVEESFLTRVATYEKMITETEDAKRVTLLVVPTIIEAREWTKRLKAHVPLTLTSALSSARREEMIGHAAGVPEGIVITTPGFVGLPIKNLGRIIIERVSAGGYTLPKRPYLDVRVALTNLATTRNIPIAYGDYPLPLEYRKNTTKPLKTAPENKLGIYDARKKEGEETKFLAIPEPIREQIKEVLDTGGRVAVIAIRRGYAPVVVCRDCGTTATDEYGRALSLSITGPKRIMRSADGTTVEDARIHCKVCGSWNLMPLGIGIERVEEEIHAVFPNAPITRIDADTLGTKARAPTQAQIAAPGIVIGTEQLLTWISPAAPVELSVIASADSLLALPFWRARERFVRVGLMLRERSARTIISTRRSEDEVFSALTTPTTSDFWKEETELRKLLHYPPYGTLLVFQSEGSQAATEKTRELIREICAPLALLEMPARQISATQMRSTSVLHVPNDAWPNADLAARLAQLPPSVRITINSETFW